MSGGNSDGLKGKPNRTGGSSPPKPRPKPNRAYTSQDVADRVNKRLDGE